MTFLSKLGSFLAKAGVIFTKAIEVASGIGPIISPFLGSKGSAVEATAVNDLTAIGQVVLTAETLIQTPGSGTAKLAAATPLVMNILTTSELFSGHKIANEALFAQGAGKITGGLADCLNSLDSAPVPTPPSTTVPAVPAT